MDGYFRNITKILNFKPYKYPNTININSAVSKFDNHLSIKMIKEDFPDAFKSNFEFTEVSQYEAKKRSFIFKY